SFQEGTFSMKCLSDMTQNKQDQKAFLSVMKGKRQLPQGLRCRSARARAGAAAAGTRRLALLTDGVRAVREQQGPGAAPGGSGGCLGPGMSSADDDHVEARRPGRGVLPAEPGRRRVLFGEGSRDPATTASEGEHSWRMGSCTFT
uniref:Uncharacterized protein n=1 Tax=Equus asinus TaxID=9793 RepID=A0A8C4L5Z5_EQUAS